MNRVARFVLERTLTKSFNTIAKAINKMEVRMAFRRIQWASLVQSRV
jgi:hypothetical protein